MSEFEMNESAEEKEMHNEQVDESAETFEDEAGAEAEQTESPELEKAE